jgi:hypothetical protein
MKLEFIDKYGTEDTPCSVWFKGVRIFTIRYEKSEKKYWICTHSNFIEFRYYAVNPDNDLDFVAPHKYSKTLFEAKNNCKKIMYSYINWLTEK